MPKLKHVCTIQLGLTARGRLERVEAGGLRAIQLRDTPPEGGRNIDVIGQYMLEAVPDRYWARCGDILFRSRGDRNTATALNREFDEPTIAVMPLVILRPDPKLADGAYLAWFINQPNSQRYFDGCARGTSMRMIPIDCLSDLEVQLPDLARQRAIAEVDSLARREFNLVTRLAEKRRQLTALALMQCANQLSQRHTGEDSVSSSRPKKQGVK